MSSDNPLDPLRAAQEEGFFHEQNKALIAKMKARLAADQTGQALREAGLESTERVYSAEDLVGENVMFAATGVTGGHLLDGVQFFRGGARTSSVVVRSATRTVRWLETHHHFDFKPEY